LPQEAVSSTERSDVSNDNENQVLQLLHDVFGYFGALTDARNEITQGQYSTGWSSPYHLNLQPKALVSAATQRLNVLLPDALLSLHALKKDLNLDGTTDAAIAEEMTRCLINLAHVFNNIDAFAHEEVGNTYREFAKAFDQLVILLSMRSTPSKESTATRDGTLTPTDTVKPGVPDATTAEHNQVAGATEPTSDGEGKKNAVNLGDGPDARGLVADPSDKHAYRAASKIISEHSDVAKNIKALNRILANHSDIRRWKPNNQRLMVHLGDWMMYIDNQKAHPAAAQTTHLLGMEALRGAPIISAGQVKRQITGWQCRSCGASYPDSPERCPHCGKSEFDSVMSQPNIPQSQSRK
jgi:hypothetical protein